MTAMESVNCSKPYSHAWSYTCKALTIIAASLLVASCATQQANPPDESTAPLPTATLSIEDVEALGQQLIEAVMDDDAAAAETLLDAGADVNATDSTGRTSLTLAAVRGNVEIAQMLLEAGADLESKTDDGYTALEFAVINGHVEIVQLLIEAGVDLTAKNCYYGAVNRWHEETWLITAAIQGNAEIVQHLVDVGMDIDWVDEVGRSAAAHAAFSGHSECLDVLIEAGADLDQVDFRGMTALDWAIRQDHKDAVEMLQAAGARTKEDIEASGQQVIVPTIRPVDCTE
jgi:ankyrin repeat protein